MTDEKFFERLREDAAALRYEPDDLMRVRIAARVRARIAAQPAPSVSQVLAAWFRPLAASLAALALAATIGLALMEGIASEQEGFGSNPVEVSMAGGYGVAE
jgi:negative regulator of sigma E activity